MATWDGSTTVNLESIEEGDNRAKEQGTVEDDDDDDDDIVDEEDDGLIQVEEEEEGEDIIVPGSGNESDDDNNEMTFTMSRRPFRAGNNIVFGNEIDMERNDCRQTSRRGTLRSH